MSEENKMPEEDELIATIKTEEAELAELTETLISQKNENKERKRL